LTSIDKNFVRLNTGFPVYESIHDKKLTIYGARPYCEKFTKRKYKGKWMPGLEIRKVLKKDSRYDTY
jgi:hypothetical protein